MKTYQLTDDKKFAFAAMILLEMMINQERRFPVLLEGDDRGLDALLTQMSDKGWLDITKKNLYAPSALGMSRLKMFMARYSEFLNTLDIFHSVDLESGEFAMARFHELSQNELAWDAYLAEERWEDLRVAVCELKGIDPVEIVFMSFLNTGRVDTEGAGWQFNLALGTMWQDILNVCNTALQKEDLAYPGVTGENVLQDVIKKGTELLVSLFIKDKQLADEYAASQEEEVDEYTVTTVTTVTYYDSYYDPYYYDPIWGIWYW